MFYLGYVCSFVDGWSRGIKDGYQWTMDHKILSWNDPREKRLILGHCFMVLLACFVPVFPVFLIWINGEWSGREGTKNS